MRLLQKSILLPPAIALTFGIIGLENVRFSGHFYRTNSLSNQVTPTPAPGSLPAFTSGSANMREQATTGSSVVASLPGGAHVTILDTVQGKSVTLNGITSDLWYQVRANNDIEGYLWSGLVQVEITVGSVVAANNRVFLRETPENQGRQVHLVVPDTQMTIEEVRAGEALTVEDNTGDTWYRVRVVDGNDALYGYIWSGFVHLAGFPMTVGHNMASIPDIEATLAENQAVQIVMGNMRGFIGNVDGKFVILLSNEPQVVIRRFSPSIFVEELRKISAMIYFTKSIEIRVVATPPTSGEKIFILTQGVLGFDVAYYYNLEDLPDRKLYVAYLNPQTFTRLYEGNELNLRQRFGEDYPQKGYAAEHSTGSFETTFLACLQLEVQQHSGMGVRKHPQDEISAAFGTGGSNAISTEYFVQDPTLQDIYSRFHVKTVY